jgi:hypothetical protein
MLENMFFEVNDIFDNAPKLFMEHYDDQPKCLPKDLIIVNAFGQLSETQSINSISNLLLSKFTNLSIKKKIIMNIMKTNKSDGKDVLSIQVSILSKILLQMQDELFE